eukprot:61893_1
MNILPPGQLINYQISHVVPSHVIMFARVSQPYNKKLWMVKWAAFCPGYQLFISCLHSVCSTNNHSLWKSSSAVSAPEMGSVPVDAFNIHHLHPPPSYVHAVVSSHTSNNPAATGSTHPVIRCSTSNTGVPSCNK